MSLFQTNSALGYAFLKFPNKHRHYWTLLCIAAYFCHHYWYSDFWASDEHVNYLFGLGGRVHKPQRSFRHYLKLFVQRSTNGAEADSGSLVPGHSVLDHYDYGVRVRIPEHFLRLGPLNLRKSGDD